MADSHWRHALVNGDSHRKETSPGERYSAVRCPSALPIDLLKIDDLVKPPPINLASGLDVRSSESRARPADCYIDRLPPELLCAIFLMCGQMDEEFNYPREDMSRPYRGRPWDLQRLYSRAAVCLGYVCARWFAITRAFPRLWTMVDVDTPEPCDVANLRRCIWYSNGLPLTLRMHERSPMPPRDYSPTRRACREFMRTVASVSFLWEEVSILQASGPLSLEEQLEPLLAVSPGAYRHLQRATIWCWSPSASGPIACRLWEMFFASPSIRTAQWFSPVLHVPSRGLSKLTHIGANHIPPEKILDLLRSCPQVEVLQVAPNATIYTDYFRIDVVPVLHVPIVLPHLRKLMLGRMHKWANFFGSITAPNLDRLDIACSGVQARAIESMLRRSNARLSMLSIRCLYYDTASECAALLRSAPLQRLRILLHEVPSETDKGELEKFDPVPVLPSGATLMNDFELADQAYSLIS